MRGKLRGRGNEGKENNWGLTERGRVGKTVKNPMQMRPLNQKERDEAVSLQIVASLKILSVVLLVSRLGKGATKKKEISR